MEANNPYVKEQDVEDNAVSIPTSALNIISELSEKCICKIKPTVEIIATGFFCAIPFPDKYNRLPVLVTNNHVLKNEDIAGGKIIRFSTNNEKYKFEIKIDIFRKRYTNEKYNITFIEIKKDIDKININSFLDIDDDIFDENYENLLDKKSVYLLHYPHGNLSEYSSGIIKGFFADEKYSFRHSCQTQKGSSGSPIINLLNHKVIGIHKGYKENLKYNIGTLLKEPINDFYTFITEKKESIEFLEKSLKNIVNNERLIEEKYYWGSYIESLGFIKNFNFIKNIFGVIRKYLKIKNKGKVYDHLKPLNFRDLYNNIIEQINKIKFQIENYNYDKISINELNDIEYNVNLINENFPGEKFNLLNEFYNSLERLIKKYLITILIAFKCFYLNFRKNHR
jgi:hypothetical protein